MIDFHNHILPGADDGAKTIEESIEMLRLAQKQGVTDIVNTIHFQHPKMEGMNTDYDYILSIKEKLIEEMSIQKIDINIHLGAEVFFNFNLLDICDNKITTFGDGAFMLIEFQTHQFPDGYDEHLYELASSGVTPIIAHPERYKPIQRDIAILEKLILSGCIIQLDAGSLLGNFGKNCYKTAIEIISRNMCHILGSDAHNSTNRNFCLIDAIKVIEKKIGISCDPLVKENPLNIINGDRFDTPEIIYKRENILNKIINKYF